MEISGAFGPFFVGSSLYSPISSIVGYHPAINYGHAIIANNPAIPFRPPPNTPINAFNNPQIIFPTSPFTMAYNTPISFHAPAINTIHHPLIITPHNPPATFYGGCPFHPHQVALRHIIAPSYWPGSSGMAPPGSGYFDDVPRNDWFTVSSPCSSTASSETPRTDPAEEDNRTMGRPVDHPSISFHPPIFTPHNPPVSYFCGYPFYPPIAQGQLVTSSYWPGPAGSAPRDSAYFGADPRHHYFTRSSSPYSSTGSNETPPDDDLIENDERRMVEGPAVRVNCPVEVGNKEDKPHGMDVASLPVIMPLFVSLLNDCDLHL